MFTPEQYEQLKKLTAPKIEFKKRRGASGGVPATTPPEDVEKPSTELVRPKKHTSGYDPRDIRASGPQFQQISGAYDQAPARGRKEKTDRGEFAGVRRERQIDLKNRRYARLSNV